MPDIDIDFSVRGRERVDPLRDREVRQGVGRPDRHLRQDVPRARPRATPPACSATTTAPATAWPSSSPSRSWAARRPSTTACSPAQELAKAVRRGPDGQADRRRRPRPRGHRAQLVDPRRRRGHRRPPADRHRPAPARRRGHGRRGQEGLPHGHAVRDGPGRGARPAEDGLPRPAQPRRDRGRARHHRALRSGERPDMATLPLDDVKTFEMLAARRLGRACSSSSPRACARPCGRCARRSSTTSSRSTRSTARARWTRSPPTPAASATPSASPTATSACARSSRRPRA